MVFSLLVSVETLLWAVVLLLFIMYTFAICFTSECAAHLQTNGGREANAQLYDYFGTLFLSMYSLWLSISGGMNWYYIIEPLWKAHTGLAVLFICYISITVLGVMNIVTSIFVESAMQSTQHYKDLMLQEKARTKEMFGKHMKHIFQQIDVDGSGMITQDELRSFLDDESLQLQSYFEALELDAEDAKALFKLLDRDDSGEIHMYEFCEGCMRLKGEAKSFDINCLLHYSRRMESKVCHIMNGFSVFVDLFEQFLQRPSAATDCRHVSAGVPAMPEQLRTSQRRSQQDACEQQHDTVSASQEHGGTLTTSSDPPPQLKPGILTQHHQAGAVSAADTIHEEEQEEDAIRSV